MFLFIFFNLFVLLESALIAIIGAVFFFLTTHICVVCLMLVNCSL
nr:MAG TPA_asm: hypothetical protein [Caudoviricetes sp.]